MKQISGKNLVWILQRRGWSLVRVTGSHHVLTKAGAQERIVVPVHANQPLKIGLLRSLLKVAGLSDDDL